MSGYMKNYEHSVSPLVAAAALCSPLEHFPHQLELVVDHEDNCSDDRGDSSALGTFMSNLLNSALLIVDNKEGDCSSSEDVVTSPAATAIATNEEKPTTKNLAGAREFVLVSDNAKLPFQEGRRRFRRDRPERRYSERAEAKRETRWSSLNGHSPRCAGLTVPTRQSSMDYSNLPMPTIPGRKGTDSSFHAVSPKSRSFADTMPTYPRCRRRSSA